MSGKTSFWCDFACRCQGFAQFFGVVNKALWWLCPGSVVYEMQNIPYPTAVDNTAHRIRHNVDKGSLFSTWTFNFFSVLMKNWNRRIRFPASLGIAMAMPIMTNISGAIKKAIIVANKLIGKYCCMFFINFTVNGDAPDWSSADSPVSGNISLWILLCSSLGRWARK